MPRPVIIPAKEIRALIESHIMNEFKTDKFKWVMTENNAGRQEYQTIGDIKIELEEDHE